MLLRHPPLLSHEKASLAASIHGCRTVCGWHGAVPVCTCPWLAAGLLCPFPCTSLSAGPLLPPTVEVACLEDWVLVLSHAPHAGLGLHKRLLHPLALQVERGERCMKGDTPPR